MNVPARIIDLTRPLNSETMIYGNGEYSDPALSVSEWSSIDRNGFRVSAISMGTQTGTHIDAPNHFDPDGDTLEKLDISELMGSFFIVRLRHNNSLSDVMILMEEYSNEKILFLKSCEPTNLSGCKPPECSISVEALDYLLQFPPVVWITDLMLDVDGEDDYGFNRMVAFSGKYLVEDIDSTRSKDVVHGGEAIIMPLRLEGVSGSPCRVVVRQLDRFRQAEGL